MEPSSGLLNDFAAISPMPGTVFHKYAGAVPSEITDIWASHGLGSFYAGYFRVINPDDYGDLLDESYIALQPAIPVLATAMGDLIAWQNGNLHLLNYRHGLIHLIGSPRLFFHLLKRQDEGFLEDALHWLPYPAACERLGVPEYGKCFAYVPILGSGGPEVVENLEHADLKTHIQVITALMGPLDTYKVSS